MPAQSYFSGVIKSYQGEFPKVDGSGNALTWYVVSSETLGNDTIKTVSSFLTVSDTAHMKLNDSGAYSYVNQARELSIVSAYFPDNSGIATISMSDGGYGKAYGFKYESELLFLRLPNTLTALPERIVQATPILEFYASEDALYPSLSPTSFYDCRNLRCANIPKNVEIIYSHGHVNNGFTFYNCVSMTDFEFAENGKLHTIQIHAFSYCNSMKEFAIPNTVTNLGERVFEGCKSLETVRLGANAGNGVEKYSVQSMLYQCSSLKYVYISETMIPASGSHLFNDGAVGMVFFYTGDYEKYENYLAILKALGSNGKFTGATPIEWDSTKDDQYYKDLASDENKNYVVYGYGKCQAFYGGHSWLGEEKISLKSYFEPINIVDSCKNCEEQSTVEQLSAIFTYYGYSCTENAINGVYSMSQFYGFNKEAKQAYVEKTGLGFELGLVAASVDNPIGSEYEGSSKVVIAPENSFAKDYFFVKISGITDVTLNRGVVFCAFVKDGDSIYYLDGGLTSQIVTCKSYNDIL